MHLTPRQVAELRAEFAKGGLEASLLAAQFLEMIEKAQVQLRAAEAAIGSARRELAAHELAALERLFAEAVAGGRSCPTCHDAVARTLLERLRAIATDAAAPPRRA